MQELSALLSLYSLTYSISLSLSLYCYCRPFSLSVTISSLYCCIYILYIGPSILLVVEGEAKMTVGHQSCTLRRGTVLFISAGAELKFADKKERMLIFRAFCEL